MEPKTLSELFAATFGLPAVTAMWIAILSAGVAWAVSKWFEGSLSKRNAIEIERLKSDLDAQSRKVQASLDTSTHVRRAQFEVEFRAYQEIWTTINALYGATRLLYYGVEDVGPSHGRNERYTTYLNSHAKALAAAGSKAFEFGPFYDEEVYKAIEAFLIQSSSTQHRIREIVTSGMGTAEEVEDSFKRLSEIYDQVSQSIRLRLTRVVIIE